MTAIETKHRGHRVIYVEADDNWLCPTFGLTHANLRGLRVMIDNALSEIPSPPLKVRLITDAVDSSAGLYAYVDAVRPDGAYYHGVLAYDVSMERRRAYKVEDFAFDTAENQELINEWLFLRKQLDDLVSRTRRARKAIPRCTVAQLIEAGVRIEEPLG